MQEQSRRKPRIPLSPEELYYFKQLKKLNQIQKLEEFKATLFYKITNYINIILAGFLTYCVLSIIILCSWQQSSISKSLFTYGAFNPENNQRTISEIQLYTTSGELIIAKTNYLYEHPKEKQAIFLGKDFLFHKTLKVKFIFDDRAFWNINSYASLTVCCFALGFGFFVYKINKHLTTNGLLVVFGLFFLASFYFILI